MHSHPKSWTFVLAILLLPLTGASASARQGHQVSHTGPASRVPPLSTECCDTSSAATFTVQLPLVVQPPHDPGENWARPDVWAGHPATADSIEIPNGRPIYALIVSGYARNGHLDELMVYNFARHLMQQGAYVHYAWWNNLLGPYMAKPLHYSQSYPGDLSTDSNPLGGFYKFNNLAHAADKAIPGEDYQFVADAKLMLEAIRAHNPSAIIVLVGHSMGGGSLVHLASQTTVVIDLLALLDSTNNRNFPFGGDPALYTPLQGQPSIAPAYLNWTRWRDTRANFRGFKQLSFFSPFPDPPCINPTGPWLPDVAGAATLVCGGDFYWDSTAPQLVFGNKIINLHNRWQNEFVFPYDFSTSQTFGHQPPPGGTTSHALIPTLHSTQNPDPGGWGGGLGQWTCCPTAAGHAWPGDGHGEMIGDRGPAVPAIPVPLGTRVADSDECNHECAPGLSWPTRVSTYNILNDVYNWLDPGASARVLFLEDLESLPAGQQWLHQPTNPDLCLVAPGLIQRFDVMNRPPIANAGNNQSVQSTGQGVATVTLNGSGSSDPDMDTLTYTWTWPTGSASGVMPVVTLPVGMNCITLEVKDPSGHIDRARVCVAVHD